MIRAVRDKTMQELRRVRRRMNKRLLEAERNGRLEEELAAMERRARAWLADGKPRRGRKK